MTSKLLNWGSAAFSKAFIVFFVFSVFSTLASDLIGAFFRNTWLIITISAVLTYFALKKFPIKLEYSPVAIALSVISLAVLVYPLLFVHPYYPASADAAPTIATRLVAEKIPETHEPYSKLRFVYQLGFPLFARIFVDLFPNVEDFLIIWFFGVIFAFAQVPLVYSIVKEFTKSELTSNFAAALMLGSKPLFQHMYYGEYPELMATAFALLFLILFMRKNLLAAFVLPAVFVAHPASAFSVMLVTLIYSLFFNSFGYLLKILPGLLLAARSLIVIYLTVVLTLFEKVLAMSLGLAETPVTLANLVKITVSLPLWVGVLPSLFVAFSIWVSFKQLKKLDKTKKFLMWSFLISIILYYVFFVVGTVMRGKIVTFASLLAILFSAVSIDFRKFSLVKNAKLFLLLLIIGSLFVHSTSSLLTHLRTGSKISPEEAKFAFAFREFDPSLKKIVHITGEEGKIAEFAHKIPYDVTSAYFETLAYEITRKDPTYQERLEKAENKKQILGGCIQCVYSTGADYIIVNQRKFSGILPSEWKKVFNHNSFEVYKLS